ncbi:MAG: hypothetical protein CME31_12845 [Gimesia sp.]|jgi:prepilin-type processing-associated H-X9-DG protein|uniref:DUF1559 domain-containing protein n=1 Tax=Gimesia maris TaxID=122 RepID=A0A3D3R695_9PLAN|nr:hypothetical protein [Gimesia sp.]HCO24325.1 hypothetical protein [Gimesia maris]|tara:strand:+ start:17766 stop:18815 length:1050 start_codon:yes stop_codon:yes gene_type:complete
MSWQRWISISLVLGMLLLAFGLIMPAVFQAREAARRNTAKNNLKQIGLALFNYHESYRCLPPGGTIREDDTAMQGWIAMMMPFLDASPYYSWLDFNESWQSTKNRYVFDQKLFVFLIPGVEQQYTDSGFALTQIMGNPNLLHRNSDVTFEEMTNGLSFTWLAGEATGDFQPWCYPFNWRPLGTKLCQGPASYGRPEWGGGHLLFADGHIKFFTDATSSQMLQRYDAAPPVATKAETAVPKKVFQTGNFHWDRIDLQSDPEGRDEYFAYSLSGSANVLLKLNVYSQVLLTEEEQKQPKSYLEGPQFLLEIDSTTDIAAALKATPLVDAATSEQLEANVKTLQALQKRLQK